MQHALDLTEASLFIGRDPGWSGHRYRFLAEGDSWFSLGSLNPLTSANLLQEMRFSQRAGAVHCAYPGDTLRRMVSLREDPRFVQLIAGNAAWRWDAILLSAGGNDLIDAAGSPPSAPLDRRLLRGVAEWGAPGTGALRYLSEPGWQTFAAYFRANLALMVELRDRQAGENGNRGRPLCLHTYAFPTPRPAGAGAGQGPWLMPAMQAYGIPQADWTAVAHLLLDRLAELMLACAADPTTYPAVHVFDTRKLPIRPAALGSTGESGDWLNEIHLTRDGCRKLAEPWAAQIEAIVAKNP
ncbi:MAG: hypothetical protein Fur0014_09110 [Rubrivivax sp.]